MRAKFKILGQRKVWAWALYDWANSSFATTVMAGFFPLFFKKFWAAGLEPTASTAQLGFANSIASIVLAMLSPILGALADTGSRRKLSLGVFTVFGASLTAALFFVPQNSWDIALLCYVLAYIGYSLALVFYDSLIQNVSSNENVDLVSSVGYGLGYLGGGVLFVLNVWMFLSPSTFGLVDGAQAIRVSFLSVAVWWILFSLPALRWVPEVSKPATESFSALVRKSFSQLRQTIQHIRGDRNVWMFLLAYWLYMDGVSTIIKMAVDFGLSIGLDDKALITALLITQFVGFPSAIAFGYIAKRFSPKRGILAGIAVYLLVVFLGTTMTTSREFFMLAILVGLVQGGVQALSRSYFSRLVPDDKSAEYFGFFNLMGRFVSFIGPALIAVMGLLTHDPRAGMASLAILFVLGGGLLLKVRT